MSQSFLCFNPYITFQLSYVLVTSEVERKVKEERLLCNKHYLSHAPSQIIMLISQCSAFFDKRAA